MKFGLRFALLAQTKCQNMAPRLSRVTRLSASSPSYDYASEECTVVFDADGMALRGREHSTCAPSTRPREFTVSHRVRFLGRRMRRAELLPLLQIIETTRAGAYCMEEAALMSRVNVENCVRDSANPEEECDVPPKYQELMDRIIQKKPKPQGPAPTVTVVDSEGSFEEYIGRPL